MARRYEEPDDVEDAIQMWETFNQLDWRKAAPFAPSLRIPDRLVVLGAAEYVMYRSAKRDPETGRVPRKPVDYIHEHDANVRIAVPLSSKLRLEQRRVVAPPAFIRNACTLARLGQCLGFAYHHGRELEEIEASSPYPELYAIASGKALIVVHAKSTLEAVIWGGRLDVESRGIVH
jgi:hypothetical protein